MSLLQNLLRQASNLTLPEFMRFHAQDMMEDEDYEFDYEDSDQVLALNYLPEGECLRENLSNARVCAHTETGLLFHSITHARARTPSLTLAHALIIRTMTYSFPPCRTKMMDRLTWKTSITLPKVRALYTSR